MKNLNHLYAKVGSVASLFGVNVSKAAPITETLHALALLAPTISRDMLRLGGRGDGSYFIPNDLEGITHCFSPGVGPSSTFEFDLAERGIKVLMADASVPGPATSHKNFRFRPAHLASFSEANLNLISMNDWVQSECGSAESRELLLQMDVEGSEYEIIHSMSEDLLCSFRIIVIEFHHLNQLRHGIMCSYMMNAFRKLLTHFRVCYAQENWAAGGFSIDKKKHSRLLEVSFLRADRL